jgi:hypothetical protein
MSQQMILRTAKNHARTRAGQTCACDTIKEQLHNAVNNALRAHEWHVYHVKIAVTVRSNVDLQDMLKT